MDQPYKEYSKLELMSFWLKINALPKEDLEKARQLFNPVIVEYTRLISEKVYEPSTERVTARWLFDLWAKAEKNVWERSILPILEDK